MSDCALAIPDLDGSGPEKDFPGLYRAVAFSDSHVPFVDCAVCTPEKEGHIAHCDVCLADADVCISDPRSSGFTPAGSVRILAVRRREGAPEAP